MVSVTWDIQFPDIDIHCVQTDEGRPDVDSAGVPLNNRPQASRKHNHVEC